MREFIACSALVVVRDGNRILTDLTLELPEGKIVGILGPSGSGKTTLMRCIAGLQRIESGTLSILGREAGDSSLREKISYSTQIASVYEDLTVLENIEYFAKLYKNNEKSIKQILDEVDITKNSHQLARTLSGGERSRLALATALVGTPQLLILDEPTVGLDPVLRVQLWKLFRSLTSQGKSILVSSHVMDEADNCDILILLRNGRLLATGSPAELRQRSGKSSMEDVFLSLVGEK